MSQPRISVVIPTYQRNDLLAQCLDCLAPDVQLLPASDYEVIVSDDGSQSTARAMVEERYPWARWVAGPKRGPAANRNAGAAQARGEWIAFTDDDCLPKPAWLQAFADAITPEVSVYEGKTTCEAGLQSPLETAPVNLTGGFLWSCNMMVRASLFEEMRGFDVEFPAPCNEDVEFRERLEASGRRFLWVEEAVVDHPPRPQLKGVAMGKRGESHIRLWYSRGNRKSARGDLLWYLLLFRLREIRWRPLGLDSAIWFGSSLVELAYIALHLRRWNRRQRAAFRRRAKREAN